MLTLSTPMRMEPPATPPLRSSTSQPGLFTSKDLMMMRRGGLVKLRVGTGIFLIKYSHTTSMFSFSWAEIGITGAPSAIVPGELNRHDWDSYSNFDIMEASFLIQDYLIDVGFHFWPALVAVWVGLPTSCELEYLVVLLLELRLPTQVYLVL